jgi:hypothetical protein
MMMKNVKQQYSVAFFYSFPKSIIVFVRKKEEEFDP